MLLLSSVSFEFYCCWYGNVICKKEDLRHVEACLVVPLYLNWGAIL